MHLTASKPRIGEIIERSVGEGAGGGITVIRAAGLEDLRRGQRAIGGQRQLPDAATAEHVLHADEHVVVEVEAVDAAESAGGCGRSQAVSGAGGELDAREPAEVGDVQRLAVGGEREAVGALEAARGHHVLEVAVGDAHDGAGVAVVVARLSGSKREFGCGGEYGAAR